MSGDPTLAELTARSRRLGADRSICNWGGGNTSAKTVMLDFRGRERSVMWVKGSGSDLGEATVKSFTPLFLEDVLPLIEREAMSDEEMVAYLAHSVAGQGYPRPSIETLLHAFLPWRHIDHTHPDAIISLACAPEGERIMREIYGETAVWVPYLRPGFELSRLIALLLRENPQTQLVVMGKHGLITWGETSEEAERNTFETVAKAKAYIDARRPTVALAGQAVAPLAPADRQELVAAVAPALRGLLSERTRQVLHFDDSDAALDFVCSVDGRRLSQVGAACPDHLVHIKWLPLWIDWQPGGSAESLVQGLQDGVQRFVTQYISFWQTYSGGAEPTLDPHPRVVLIPGLGMFTSGRDMKMAEICAQLYHRAIAVSGGAEAIDRYVSLTAEEAYHVEHWPLELYKLTLAGPERELSRRVAFITGAASGIGRVTARRLAQEGANVVLADINVGGAREAAAEIVAEFGAGRALPVGMDVTREEAVIQAFRQAVLTYGGVDIVVNNAGLAIAHPIEETSLADWQKGIDVLATGYFLVAREAFKVFTRQGRGGNLIFVASKNAIVGGKNVSAYSAAKGAEVQLARCLAEEGGARSIRVNTVCPDAVIQGTGIFDQTWRAERARAYKIEDEQLEEHYRQRTALKVNILPKDVAEAILFFASDRSLKTTGCMITVDGGVQAAYLR